LVDIGEGREMYLECRGTGSPTVVLVSGFRGSNDDWTNVVDPEDSAGAPKPSDYPNDVSGLVLIDPGSEFLQTELTSEQWATFVQAAKQLGDSEDLEAADYESSVEALRAAPPVGAILAVVLTSDKPFDFGAGEGTWPAWLAAQDRLATLLSAEHITDTNSGHYIAGEQPQLVIDAIRQVVDAERDNAETGAL
jgi:pimeloyl-ACP methyl ester carboxylesterase